MSDSPTKQEKKKQKTPSNRFEIERLKVSDELEGVILASFQRRSAAFLIDISMLSLLSYFWWLILIAYLFMKLTNRKLGKTVRRAKTTIHWQMRTVDRRLEGFQVDEKVRGSFQKHLMVYLYVAMYLPIIVALIYAVGFFSKFISKEEGEEWFLSGALAFANSLSPIDFLISGIVSVLYFGIFNYWFQGQTIGKKLMGIRVLKLNGKKITFWGSIERATGYAASGSLFLYGFFQFFWDPNRQTTHDKITETIVVSES